MILQRAVELPDAREPEEVLAALRPLEHELLPRAVALFARGALCADPENPRRTPVDRTIAATAVEARGDWRRVRGRLHAMTAEAS